MIEIRTVSYHDAVEPELDEIVARDAYVHFERMADAQFWMLIDDGVRQIHVNFGAVNERAKGFASYFEDYREAE